MNKHMDHKKKSRTLPLISFFSTLTVILSACMAAATPV
jgi:hypothetical protein